MQLAVASLLLSSTTLTAHAHEVSVNDKTHCNIHINNSIRLTPEQLEIVNKNKQRMVFSQGQLRINGELIQLNDAQTQALTSYSDQLRTYAPQVAQVAIEGVAIASTAIAEVGEALSLSNTDRLVELTNDIGEKIKRNFYQQGVFVLGEQDFEQLENNINQQFEAEFGEVLEQAMRESMGSLLMAIGAQFLNGDDENTTDFEQRMEAMGERIEQQVQQQAKQLEQKANQLCHSFTDIAQTEQQVQSLIPQLKPYALITEA